MKKRIQTLSLLFLALAVAAPVCAASRAKELFQRALIKESVERDLDGAVMFYQRAIDEARAEPAIAGEARLRMAICFEKLGKSVYAEGLYHQILEHPYKLSSDVIQQARTNLRRIEAEKHSVESRVIVIGSSGTVQGTWVHEFYPLPFSALLGPALLASSNGTPVTALSLGLRFRTSNVDRPTAWYLDARGTVPLSHSTVGNQSEPFDAQGTDNASLSFRYQTSLGLVGELPHGNQKKVIPEVGTGFALTSAKINDQTHTTAGPYLETGVHLFPDRLISVLVQARYISTPYPKSVDIQAPSHSQTFNFPSSQWVIGATLQIKIGYRKWVLKSQP